jgi:putative addiction module killer protein
MDSRAKAAIDARIARLRGGNFGDSRPVGEGVSESVIDFGPGYRIYYRIHGDVIILLHGGDKSTQSTDIKLAIGYWKEFKGRNS